MRTRIKPTSIIALFSLALLCSFTACQEDSLAGDVEIMLNDSAVAARIEAAPKPELFKHTSNTDRGRSLSSNDNTVSSINLNQIIIFNIGDSSPLDTNISSSYKQRFDQESVNYCNFDPLLLSNKNSRKLTNYRGYDMSHSPPDLFDDLSASAELIAASKPHAPPMEDLNVNIFLKGDVFNESSEITGLLENYYLL
jgi:hypothetical protein